MKTSLVDFRFLNFTLPRKFLFANKFGYLDNEIIIKRYSMATLGIYIFFMLRATSYFKQYNEFRSNRWVLKIKTQ